MATRKKKRAETEFDRQQAADRKTRDEIFGRLWLDKKYLRLQAFKDAALRAWNMADAYKSSAPGGVAKAKKADERARRALARLYAYERAAHEKAGLTY
jgi:hypothetical protein